jgi:hypothetical protein
MSPKDDFSRRTLMPIHVTRKKLPNKFFVCMVDEAT